MKNQKNVLMAALFLALTTSSMAQAGEVAVVVGASSPASTMSADQVAQIFLGKSTSLVPVDQNEGSVKTDFYKKVADKDLPQVKSIWSKIAFTGKGVPPKEIGGNAEVKKHVASDPKAVGYIDKSAVDGTVKVILTVQ